MSYILDDSKQIKNYIINGALDFWQRVAGNTSTVSSSAAIGGYTADRIFNTSNGSGVNVKNYSVTRSTNIPTVSQSGFQSVYSYLFTAVSTMSTFAVGDFVAPFEYRVEGFDYSKIATKTVSFGFWVNASVVGSYNFALRNGALNRSYVTTFTINSANTWEFKSITVTLDTAGTYASDNTLALFVDIGAIAGTASQTSTLGSWQAGNVYTSSSVNNYLTAGATLSITQFSLVEGGSIGPKGFTRAGAAIQQELSLCQRYYEVIYLQTNQLLGTFANSNLFYTAPIQLVSKRANPAATLGDSVGSTTALGYWTDPGIQSYGARTTYTFGLNSNSISNIAFYSNYFVGGTVPIKSNTYHFESGLFACADAEL